MDANKAKIKKIQMETSMRINKTLIVGIFVLTFIAFSTPSIAQNTFTRHGNTVYGSDGSTYTQHGNTVYGSDGSTYTQHGNTTYGSDGTTYTQHGNTTYGSDGSTYTQFGNTIYTD